MALCYLIGNEARSAKAARAAEPVHPLCPLGVEAAVRLFVFGFEDGNDFAILKIRKSLKLGT
jgi:hypothetical protein